MEQTVRSCFREILVPLCVAATVAGCEYDESVRPAAAVFTKPSASHAPQRPALSTADLPIPANSAAPLYGGTNLVSTGVVIRNGLNMRFRMGSMVATHNLAMRIECHFWWVPQGDVNPNGYPINIPPYSLVSYRAASDPAGMNVVSEGNGWSRDSSTGSWTMITWFDFLADSAFVFLKREPMDGECLDSGETYVKYFLSGQQLVTIDFPAIEVHADKKHVAQGGTARFTAAPIDFTPGGSGTTWSWHWVVSGTGTPVPSCTGLTVCDYSPPQTGYMHVSASHAPNLKVKGVSDSVEVLKCPTADSLADNPIVRKALRRALDSSFADSATTKRRERIGLIYRDTSTTPPPLIAISTYDVPAYTLSTPCRAETTSIPPSQPPFVLIAYYHTHPFSEGTATIAADTYPANCGSSLSGRRYRRGPSQPDWNTSRNTLGVPGYIIDKNRVQRFDGTHPQAANPALRRNLIQTWPWNTAACQW